MLWLADEEGSDTKTSTVATVQRTTGERANCMAVIACRLALGSGAKRVNCMAPHTWS